ncbi:MAG: hypothetical protein U0414_15350 [Polyangiaceae bacterium]
MRVEALHVRSEIDRHAEIDRAGRALEDPKGRERGLVLVRDRRREPALRDPVEEREVRRFADAEREETRGPRCLLEARLQIGQRELADRRVAVADVDDGRRALRVEVLDGRREDAAEIGRAAASHAGERGERVGARVVVHGSKRGESAAGRS